MSTRRAPSQDILVRDCGTVWQLLPLSRKASDWIEENVETEDWQWVGSSLVVDWRFVGPLLDGARGTGLAVEG